MSVPVFSIEVVGTGASVAPIPGATTAAPPAQFASWFSRELESINSQLVQADRSVQRLAVGDAASLHDTMIQLEQARLALQLAMQVRTKVLEAYQEVMRMQV